MSATPIHAKFVARKLYGDVAYVATSPFVSCKRRLGKEGVAFAGFIMSLFLVSLGVIKKMCTMERRSNGVLLPPPPFDATRL